MRGNALIQTVRQTVTGNDLIQHGLDGYEGTGIVRVPSKGELYIYPKYHGKQDALLRSGGGVEVQFEIAREKREPYARAAVNRLRNGSVIRPFPVRVFPHNESEGFPITVTEAEELVVSLEDAIGEVQEELTSYVQVSYHGKHGVPYSYLDPSGKLAVGDLVEVPVNYGTKVGEVVALGKGNWNGPYKEVAARLERKTL